MSELLALSFDVSASPSIWLRSVQPSDSSSRSAGWGFAWYPNDTAAAVIRDPRPIADSTMSAVLRDWDRFRGTVFLCHIRGAAKRPTEQDTHPFVRIFAGRSFTFAHNGRLDVGAARKLDCGDDLALEPAGTTDSERAFCWVLAQMREIRARTFADAGFETVHGWLRKLNELGIFSVVMSDGRDVIAYADEGAERPLHHVRRIPPHASTRLEDAHLCLDHSHPLDSYRSMVIISTTALGGDWVTIQPGEMLVVRRSAILYESAPSQPTLALAPDVESGAREAGWQRAAMSENATHVSVVERPGDVPEAPGEMGASANTMASAASIPSPQPEDASAWVRYAVTHRTHYRYDNPVERSSHTLRLQPSIGVDQRLIEHDVDISVDCETRHFEDVFGNRAQRVWITQPYDELEITARSIVEVRSAPKVGQRKRVTIPLVWMPWQRQMMTPFLLPPELPETQLSELSAFAMSFAERQDSDLSETLRDINTTIFRDFKYVQGVTSNDTTPFDVYVSRQGVCQDFANLFICMARLLGVASRYRVGYIHTGSNYDNTLQSEASHAWVEVYLPWVGWRGFDPTNGCRVNTDHVAVASGRNYRDATPTSGTLFKGGGNERLEVEVKLQLLDVHGAVKSTSSQPTPGA